MIILMVSDSDLWLFGILAVNLLLNAFVLARLAKAFRLLRFPADQTADGMELPTVSVCITARNETHAMTQCLERVVATEYPKLEVIVLDDGSRDNTSMLIKSFAHAGVRFIEGTPLPEGWLGKNHAQAVLAREASGKLVFFLDVDTLIDRHTIRNAVTYMLANRAAMVSFIPIRHDQWHGSTILATMRYFWTVMRFSPERPRAAANAWLIERDMLLERFGSDDTLPLSMEVETTLARHASEHLRYRLVLSDRHLGLRYEKRWTSQVETSIRLLYPQCGKQWYQVAALVAVLLFALVPYAALFVTPWALLGVVAQYGVAYYYLSHVWVRYRIIGALIVPVTLVQEAVLLVVSAYKYRHGIVTWKGRPITTGRGARS